MTSFTFRNAATPVNRFAPGVIDDRAAGFTSRRFDAPPRPLRNLAANPGAVEIDRHEEDLERWDGLS